MPQAKQIISNAIANIRPSLAKATRVWLAYSGGLDSTVLLHALRSEGVAVSALHVNHQLSPNADSWQQYCVDQCSKMRCEIVVEKVEVKNHGKGIEHAARQARYGAFDHHVGAGDILLMAHHLDDACETLLFRLLRGTGLKGITGIKEERDLSTGGRILRPLLSVTRNDILEYANVYMLSWIEDESNRDTEFDRNYLREMVLPLFQQRWPNFRKQFSISAKLLQESEQLLVEYAREDLEKCGRRDERLGSSLDMLRLMSFSPQRINHILRQWIDELGYALPGQRHLDETQKMLVAREDAVPVVAFGDCELRRYKDRVYCIPRLGPAGGQTLSWTGSQDLKLPDGSLLSFRGAVPFPALDVRFRKGGERCQPTTRGRSQTLKKLLQEYELEPWLRDRVPLIYLDNRLVAVGDLWVCVDAPEGVGPGFSWAYPSAGQDPQ